MLFNKFVDNGADIEYAQDKVAVKLKEKRDLPLLLKVANSTSDTGIPWLGGRRLKFSGVTVS